MCYLYIDNRWMDIDIELLDCYNKIPQTGCLNSRHLFLTVLEADQSRSRCWPGKTLPGLRTATFLLCFHMVEREKELWSLFLFL